MRVAYLACVYPPYPGGIGVLAQGMAREMVKHGHKVEVFVPAYQYNQQLIIPNSCFLIHQFRPWLRCGNAAFLPQLIWKLKNFNVIHLLYPFFGVAELIGLIKKKTRAKIVIHHTMDAMAPGLKGLLFDLHQKIFLKRIFQQADAVIALSEDYFNNCAIANIISKGLPVEFVPNGVDVDLFRPLRGGKRLGLDQKRPSLEEPRSVPTILFAGGLDRAHYFKGVYVLIEAMRLLKERGLKCCCNIIGDGNMRGEYEKHARDLGLMRNTECSDDQHSVLRMDKHTYIQFLGLVPHEQMPRYYQQATVAVVPSTERVECFSIVAAEAQACGIPVIVSDLPGARVTIEDGQTGYAARPGNSEDLANRIQELIGNPQKIRAMGNAGRQRAVKFYSWEKIGERLEKIYEGMKSR